MWTRRCGEDRGAVAAVVASLTVALFGLAAIVVDLGMSRDRQRAAQNAADAAALGAASVLSHALDPAAVTAGEIQQARAAADRYATANGWSAGLATFGVDPVAATVTVELAPMRSSGVFAGAVGGAVLQATARAQATWRNAPAPCALCVLGDLGAQNGQTVNSKGSILVRGSLSVAANGTVTTSTGIIGVGGTVTGRGSVVPAPVRIAPITDPYGVTPRLPPGPPAPPLGSPAATATTAQCLPGTYDDVTACRTFASGIYVITGQNRFSGTVGVIADTGVLFYVTCSARTSTGVVSAACTPGQSGGSLEFAGTVSARITALADPVYRDLAVVYDRNNTASLGLIGGPDVTVDGGVYAASATLRNNGAGPLTVDGTMVVGKVDLRGVPATVNINEQNAFADLPPFLVHLTQ